MKKATAKKAKNTSVVETAEITETSDLITEMNVAEDLTATSTTLRKCTSCEEMLDISMFSALKSGKENKTCKTCRAKASADWTKRRADFRKVYHKAILLQNHGIPAIPPSAKTWNVGDPILTTTGENAEELWKEMKAEKSKRRAELRQELAKVKETMKVEKKAEREARKAEKIALKEAHKTAKLEARKQKQAERAEAKAKLAQIRAEERAKKISARAEARAKKASEKAEAMKVKLTEKANALIESVTAQAA